MGPESAKFQESNDAPKEQKDASDTSKFEDYHNIAEEIHAAEAQDGDNEPLPDVDTAYNIASKGASTLPGSEGGNLGASGGNEWSDFGTSGGGSGADGGGEGYGA